MEDLRESAEGGAPVTVGKALASLEGGARSPNEQVKKNRLRERLRS
jgi:hypothetical protein